MIQFHNIFKEDYKEMARAKQSMDGNTAAAHVAYAFTEVQVSILSHLLVHGRCC